MLRQRGSRRSLGAAGALAAGLLGAAALSCGGGSGAGLGIATVGISAIFAGTGSPGSFAVDPDVSTAMTTSTSGVVLQREDTIALNAASAANVRRYIVLGGAPFGSNSAVRVRTAYATGTPTSTASLLINLLARDQDDPAFVSVATSTVTSSGTGMTVVDEVLPLQGPAGEGLAAGDMLQVNLVAQGAGDVNVLASSSTTPTFVDIVINVEDVRTPLDLVTGTGADPVLLRRASTAQQTPFTITGTATAPWSFTLIRGSGTSGGDFYSSDRYGAASSTPASSLTYTWFDIERTTFAIDLQSTTTSTVTGTLALIGDDGAVRFESDPVPFSVGPDPVRLQGTFPFATTPPDLIITGSNADTATPTPVALRIAVSGQGEVEVQPGGKVFLPGPNVTGVFPIGTIELSQPPRGP